MTYYYHSLNYSILTIAIRWCVFYCIWNLWTLPRLEANTERMEVSIRVPGNHNTTTIWQESLPVYRIHGHKAVLISSLLEQATSGNDGDKNITETKAPMTLPASDEHLLGQTRKGSQDVPHSQNNPLQPILANDQPSSKQRTPVQDHRTNSKTIPSPQRKKELRWKKTNARRLRATSRQNSVGESTLYESLPPNQGTSIMVLLFFTFALVGGAVFASRALTRMEQWEIQSQEDSLAYDIAYTSRLEFSSYGSFESSYFDGWEDDLSKFDV